jgi:hypothetical protein
MFWASLYNYAAWLDFEWKIVLALLKIQVLVRYDSFEQVYKIFIYSTGAIRNFVSGQKIFRTFGGKIFMSISFVSQA